MKNIKFNLLSLMALAGLLLFGCSDNNSTTPTPTDNPDDFFKMEVGNYWVYQVDQTDTSANVIPNKTSYDSTVITSSLQFQGKLALKSRHFITDENNEKLEEDVYYSVENSKFYLWADNIGNEQLKLPFDNWLLIADFDATTWTIFDSTVSVNIQLNPNISGVLNAEIKLTGSKGNKGQININNNNYRTQQFNQTLTVKGVIQTGIAPLAVNETLVIQYTFAEGIGLTRVEQSALAIKLSVFGSMMIPGSLQNLIDYNVK